jgi:hypothetical protein
MMKKLSAMAIATLLCGSTYAACWCTINANCIGFVWCNGVQCSIEVQLDGYTNATNCARGQTTMTQGDSNRCTYICSNSTRCSFFKAFYATGSNC